MSNETIENYDNNAAAAKISQLDSSMHSCQKELKNLHHQEFASHSTDLQPTNKGYLIPIAVENHSMDSNHIPPKIRPETEESIYVVMDSNYEDIDEHEVIKTSTPDTTKKLIYDPTLWRVNTNSVLLVISLAIGLSALLLATSNNMADRQHSSRIEQEKLKKQVADNSETIRSNYHYLIPYHSRDCYDILKHNFTSSGVYSININNELVEVYCDMETDGGGWTVFQKRFDGSENFNRDYGEYETGFGNKTGEHWLGLQHINALTSSRSYTLRVDLKDFDNNTVHAVYSTIFVGDSVSNYDLKVTGYKGTAGDSLQQQNSRHFKMKTFYCHFSDDKGAWWYGIDCPSTNLNGNYYKELQCIKYSGIIWRYWEPDICLKQTEMKLRPR